MPVVQGVVLQLRITTGGPFPTLGMQMHPQDALEGVGGVEKGALRQRFACN